MLFEEIERDKREIQGCDWRIEGKRERRLWDRAKERDLRKVGG